MCGIVGAVARDNIVPVLLEGLHRLEYRGYDSAGLSLISKSEKISVSKELKLIKENSLKTMENK